MKIKLSAQRVIEERLPVHDCAWNCECAQCRPYRAVVELPDRGEIIRGQKRQEVGV